MGRKEGRKGVKGIEGMLTGVLLPSGQIVR